MPKRRIRRKYGKRKRYGKRSYRRHTKSRRGVRRTKRTFRRSNRRRFHSTRRLRVRTYLTDNVTGKFTYISSFGFNASTTMGEVHISASNPGSVYKLVGTQVYVMDLATNTLPAAADNVAAGMLNFSSIPGTGIGPGNLTFVVLSAKLTLKIVNQKTSSSGTTGEYLACVMQKQSYLSGTPRGSSFTIPTEHNNNWQLSKDLKWKMVCSNFYNGQNVKKMSSTIKLGQLDKKTMKECFGDISNHQVSNVLTFPNADPAIEYRWVLGFFDGDLHGSAGAAYDGVVEFRVDYIVRYLNAKSFQE